MWISHNRVLVGGNKKITGRNPNFDTEETRVLISLWGDPKVQKTLITTHKKHAVIVKLAEKMREYGYHRSPEEINTRIKNLKCFYNRIKKDIEGGIAPDPTWKHYAAMDEIMTRPIFSVRPNEIPKPSLRYRLEEEMKERAEKERKRKLESEDSGGGGGSGCGGGVDDGDDEDEDDEDDDDVDDISFTAEMFDDEMKSPSGCKTPKKEEDTSSDVEETPLIIPKDEPIDVDEEPDEIDRSKEKEKLSSYLQLVSNSSKNDNKTATSVGNNKNENSSNTIKISQVSSNLATVFANTQAPITSQAGKISLVPTNFLLKSQPQQIQLRPQPQHRIIYTKQAVQPAPAIVASGQNTGQQVPMKVLLVNTLQKTNPTGKSLPPTMDSQIKTANVNGLQHSNITQSIGNINSNSNSASNEKQHKNSLSSKHSKESGKSDLRGLMTQLVRVGTESLEINKQRLEIEKQRFEFEKTIAEKLLKVFMASQSSTDNSDVQQQQPSHPVPPTSQSPVMVNGVVPLLVPKAEKEDDGYQK